MDTGTVSFSLLDLFRLGGIFMWPLLLFSIAVIAISLERAIYLGYHNLRVNDLAEKLKAFIVERNYSGAAEYLSAMTGRRMGARVFLALISRAGIGAPPSPPANEAGNAPEQRAPGEDAPEGSARRLPAKPRAFSEHRAERAAETEAMSCINSLENGFNFLTALGSLSPLTGFLGTVSGMIGAFRSIAEATEVNAQIVANGIYEALVTTVFGLIIAIIAMVFHSIFTHIVDRFAADVEQACSELITEIAEQNEA
ncbi:MAG: MotA/TolQ/ExbB proton channel family protein [Treponema sp.]|jgi:biopolymer transport protein ExbB|nr:MotA/TolQ/ExbB proton channel family protein [Treponema sp.]